MASVKGTFNSPLQIVHRTLDALAALIQNMSVNHPHHCYDIPALKQLMPPENFLALPVRNT